MTWFSVLLDGSFSLFFFVLFALEGLRGSELPPPPLPPGLMLLYIPERCLSLALEPLVEVYMVMMIGSRATAHFTREFGRRKRVLSLLTYEKGQQDKISPRLEVGVDEEELPLLGFRTYAQVPLLSKLPPPYPFT